MKIEELFSVRGKVALVTGGSRGIGEMIARGYVESGAKAYITARNADSCDALARELSRLGECISIPADLSRMDEVERLAAEMQRREKRLDILVNNAGASWGDDFEAFPESGWDKSWTSTSNRCFFLTQRLLKLLEAAGRDDEFARVINIGSIDGMHVSGIENARFSTVVISSRIAALFLTAGLLIFRSKAIYILCGAGGSGFHAPDCRPYSAVRGGAGRDGVGLAQAPSATNVENEAQPIA